jgi:Ulp1 family protease
MNPFHWTLNNSAACPKQSNGFDCGVFVCRLMEIISRGIVITENSFNQDSMSNYRKHIKKVLSGNGDLQYVDDVVVGVEVVVD